MIKMIQNWRDSAIIIMVDEEGRFSVQVEVYKKAEAKKQNHTDAYISQLFVQPKERKKRHATRLMEEAENVCRKYHCHTIAVGYDPRNTKPFVQRWYERKGYRTEYYSAYGAQLMIKQIAPIRGRGKVTNSNNKQTSTL